MRSIHTSGSRINRQLTAKGATILKSVAMVSSVLLTACAALDTNPAKLVPLPPVDSSNAIELNVRSQFNSSPLVNNHILRVDGARVRLYEHDDRDTLYLSPGKHTLGLSCHERNTLVDDFDINYRVADGNTTLEIEAYAGESLCLGIGYTTLNCAVLELRESSYCN